MKRSVEELMIQFNKSEKPYNPKKLVFIGVEGFDVYNPSVPFQYEEKTLIIARVEKRHEEKSKSMFFEFRDNKYYLRSDLPIFDMQDPFMTKTEDYYLVGGTYVEFNDNKVITWYTRIYYGKDLSSLKLLFDAPNGMKDVRLLELKNKKIGVFTRPQGGQFFGGRIGFTIVNNIFEVNKDVINKAQILDQFIDTEWGGVNDVYLLNNNKIGVLGHIAKYSAGFVRHYYPVAFTLNYETMEFSPMKILAERNNYLPGEYKREDLIDVLFASGLVFKENETILYCGVSDCEIQKINIEYPF